MREQLRLSMRAVEQASLEIAEKCGSQEFLIPPSRLSDIEAKGNIPSIHRVYSLAVIYGLELREILSWYGIGPRNEESAAGPAKPEGIVREVFEVAREYTEIMIFGRAS